MLLTIFQQPTTGNKVATKSKLKPGFHIIAQLSLRSTIAAILAIVETSGFHMIATIDRCDPCDRCDYMETMQALVTGIILAQWHTRNNIWYLYNIQFLLMLNKLYVMLK